jgi:hypothetical protein
MAFKASLVGFVDDAAGCGVHIRIFHQKKKDGNIAVLVPSAELFFT